jgi:hypothetical protein
MLFKKKKIHKTDVQFQHYCKYIIQHFSCTISTLLYYINVELDLRNVESISFTLDACRMLNL